MFLLKENIFLNLGQAQLPTEIIGLFMYKLAILLRIKEEIIVNW